MFITCIWIRIHFFQCGSRIRIRIKINWILSTALHFKYVQGRMSSDQEGEDAPSPSNGAASLASALLPPSSIAAALGNTPQGDF